MDSITHIVLGAALGELILRKKTGNKGAILGAIIATIPDLDVLLVPFFDDYQKLSIHRGYSHSILFCLVAAMVLAMWLKRISWTKKVSRLALFSFSFLALITHVLLDVFTPYGTQLFLPFNNARVTLDNITVIDPVYTIPILIGLLVSWNVIKIKRFRIFANKMGLLLSSSYLIFTLLNKQLVNERFDKALQKNNIRYSSMMTVPVTAGSIKWYAVAKSDSTIYIGDLNILKKDQNIAFEKFPINKQLLNYIDDDLALRMRWFAKEFYVVNEYKGKLVLYNLQCDMQGIRHYPNYKAPTVFYFEFDKNKGKTKEYKTGFHK